MKNLINKKKNSKTRIVENGRVCLTFTRSNLHVNIADDRGNTLIWSNCGVMKFKGKKKNSPLAASTLVISVIKKAVYEYNMRRVN
ncbi:MAG: 30S ribosomal protein S11, partial [Anaplasmataceae bacterium]|nr:30S ribosomal protein S11 [Anaplasmataceae bacterium]